MAKENIYEFTLKKAEKRQVETQRKNKNGEEETVLSVKTVNTPVKIVVQKPTRKMADEAEVYYSIQLSKAIKMGIVTKAMLTKKYADNGGALSEDESRELLRSLKKLNDLENEYKLIAATKKKEEKDKSEKLEIEIISLRRDLQNLESSLQSVYQHTADAKAERSTLMWYVINLTKQENDKNELVSFFDGLDFDEQLDDFYNKYESEKGFDFDVVTKISKIIGYWFYAQGSSKEDLEKFISDDGQ
tara:strand:+ start:1210 stop:1944 length:735 start_codon:yes stop_codon:yes gene_type:complete